MLTCSFTQNYISHFMKPFSFLISITVCGIIIPDNCNGSFSFKVEIPFAF